MNQSAYQVVRCDRGRNNHIKHFRSDTALCGFTPYHKRPFSQLPGHWTTVDGEATCSECLDVQYAVVPTIPTRVPLARRLLSGLGSAIDRNPWLAAAVAVGLVCIVNSF